MSDRVDERPPQVATVQQAIRPRRVLAVAAAMVAVRASPELAVDWWSGDADRHLAGTRDLDVAFVTANLSADAVPMLIGALDGLDACTAAELSAPLQSSHGDTGGWRILNLARERADHALGALPAAPSVASC